MRAAPALVASRRFARWCQENFFANEDDARALAREIFVSSADILPDEKANTLTIRLHRTATAARDRAVEALLAELNESDFVHPVTGLRMRYQLV